MIDLHTHLLPGIDDGPATLDDSLTMARAAAGAGTRTMLATPHIDHRWGVQPAEVPGHVERMRAALAEAHIELDVRGGGEIALSRLADLDPQQIDSVRLGDGPYLLIESPHRPIGGAEFSNFVARLHNQGESILLAHPERSPTFLKEPDRLNALVDGGILTSITAASLMGTFGRTVQAFSLKLLAEGLVHNVASDSHDAVRRGPELLAGLQAAERELPGVMGMADWLTRGVPEAILAGERLPERPELPTRRPTGLRRWFSR